MRLQGQLFSTRSDQKRTNPIVDKYGLYHQSAVQTACDWLPDQIKETLEEGEMHGILVDGMQLPLYDIIRPPIWVRDTRAEEAVLW